MAHNIITEKRLGIRPSKSKLWLIMRNRMLQQFKHFSIACSKLFHMVHLNQKCFSTQIWTFIVIVPWINIHANGSL